MTAWHSSPCANVKSDATRGWILSQMHCTVLQCICVATLPAAFVTPFFLASVSVPACLSATALVVAFQTTVTAAITPIFRHCTASAGPSQHGLTAVRTQDLRSCVRSELHPSGVVALRRKPLATEAPPGPPHWCTDICQDPSHAFLSPLLKCIPPGPWQLRLLRDPHKAQCLHS